jgi:hypothetical protein
MANTAVTLTAFNAPYGVDMTNSRMIVRGNANWSNGTYTLGGVAPNKPPYLDQSGQSVLIPTLNAKPDSLDLYTANASGYLYQRNNNTGNIQIFVSGNELSTGNVANAVVNDTIVFVATWVKQ